MTNKTDFPTVIKLLRIKLRPEFQQLLTKLPPSSGALDYLDSQTEIILSEHGYSLDEFDELSKRYYMDFSSDNPDEWIIRECPPSEAGIMRNGYFSPH